MRILGVLTSGVGVGVVMVGMLGAPVRPQATPQQPGIPPASQGSNPLHTGSDNGPDMSPAMREHQEAVRNDDRQKRLVADTDKLLALATQLHEDVSKTNKNVLSMDVIKKADEIEKLAHNVKERMKS